jgi:hypothetical protein
MSSSVRMHHASGVVSLCPSLNMRAGIWYLLQNGGTARGVGTVSACAHSRCLVDLRKDVQALRYVEYGDGKVYVVEGAHVTGGERVAPMVTGLTGCPGCLCMVHARCGGWRRRRRPILFVGIRNRTGRDGATLDDVHDVHDVHDGRMSKHATKTIHGNRESRGGPEVT